MMFDVAGWEVHDLGRDVPLENFVEEQLRTDSEVVAMSAMMTTTMLGMKKVIKMREMIDNQAGTIKRVSAPGEMGRRIREMGLVVNADIQIRGRAPLKDPVAIKLRDYVLTLRNNEADYILVEVDLPE